MYLKNGKDFFNVLGLIRVWYILLKFKIVDEIKCKIFDIKYGNVLIILLFGLIL